MLSSGQGEIPDRRLESASYDVVEPQVPIVKV